MRIVSLPFRDEQVTVIIDHDGGYEPDTNAHEIDWHFEEEPENVTDQEYDDIHTLLLGLEPDYFDDDIM